MKKTLVIMAIVATIIGGYFGINTAKRYTELSNMSDYKLVYTYIMNSNLDVKANELVKVNSNEEDKELYNGIVAFFDKGHTSDERGYNSYAILNRNQIRKELLFK